MPGELDVKIVCEDADSDYEGTVYFKCTSYQYQLHHHVKFFDLGMIKVLAQALGWEMTLPPLVLDFGRYDETYTINFIIKEHNVDIGEERLVELLKFARFKAAFATTCTMYIGTNINDDGTRLLNATGKGLEGKVASVEVLSRTAQGFIKGKLKFILGIDLLNF